MKENSNLVDGFVGFHRMNDKIGAGDNQEATYEEAPARNGNAQQTHHRYPENGIGDNHRNDTAAVLIDIALEHRHQKGRNKEHRRTEKT